MLQTACHKEQPGNTDKSKYETIMADSNRYMAKTLSLLIILTDDAIMFTCKPCICVTYIHSQHKPLQFYQHLFSEISHLLLTSQREREAMQDELEGLTMAQWINLNRINRSVIANQFPSS